MHVALDFECAPVPRVQCALQAAPDSDALRDGGGHGASLGHQLKEEVMDIGSVSLAGREVAHLHLIDKFLHKHKRKLCKSIRFFQNCSWIISLNCFNFYQINLCVCVWVRVRNTFHTCTLDRMSGMHVPLSAISRLWSPLRDTNSKRF